MKRKILVWLSVLCAVILLCPSAGYAKETEGVDKEAADMIGQVKQQLAAVFENVDKETAEEVFSFLKQKVQGEALYTEEGLLAAINEGKEKFGVEIDKTDAQKLVDTMEKLEDMGFSAEYVIDKTQSLYQQYGAGFVEHVDEVVTGAVKDAASNAVSSFFNNLKNSVKGFFDNLFS